MEPLFVSIIATSEALGIGRTSVYELIKAGKLDTIKMGRRRLVTVESIKRLADKQD